MIRTITYVALYVCDISKLSIVAESCYSVLFRLNMYIIRCGFVNVKIEYIKNGTIKRLL